MDERWKDGLHLADYVLKPLRGLLENTLNSANGTESIEEIYNNLTPEEAKQRVATLEQTCKSYEQRLESFQWASEPARVLATLYRRAGKDPRSK